MPGGLLRIAGWRINPSVHQNKGFTMSVAKVTEVISSSTKSFVDAVSNGV